MRCERGLNLFGLAARKATCECDVKAEFVHHVRIAPLRQKRLLPGAEPGFATAGKLGLGWRGAEGIETFDNRACQRGQWRLVPNDGQGKEASDAVQGQPVERRRRQTSRKMLHRGFKLLQGCSSGQPERRLDRAVKPVFTWRCGYLGDRTRQAQNLRVRDGRALFNVPSQPMCAERGEGAAWGSVVDTKSVKLHGASFVFHATDKTA